MRSCYMLQAKVIAVIEMVLSSICLLLLVCAAVLVATKRDDLLENLRNINQDDEDYPYLKELLESTTREQVTIFMVPIIYFLVEFCLGIFLYRSADKTQYKRLRVWVTITTTLVIVGIVFYLIEIIRSGNPDITSTSAIFMVNLAFTVYSIWVVHSLIREMKMQGVHQPVPYNAYTYKI